MSKVQQDKTGISKLDLLVFGIDANGKPRGARFTYKQFDAAMRAAQSMKLEIFEATPRELAALRKKLPAARVDGRGTSLVPYIGRDLYEKLHAASGGLVRDRAYNECRITTGK